MPIALGVNFVNSGLTAAVLTPVAARPLPLFWLGAVVLGDGGRWAICGGDTAAAARNSAPGAGRRFGGLRLALAGLCWGARRRGDVPDGSDCRILF